MKLVKDKITITELKRMAKKTFGSLVKAVIDIEKEIIVVDGDLHSDEEEVLIKNGSKQENLWGINLYPSLAKDKWVEFDSMINLRPSFNNYTMGIDDVEIQKKILKIIDKLIIE